MKIKFVKRIFETAVLSAVLSGFFSCASTSVNLRDYKRTAIVSVYGNSMIPWYSNNIRGSDEPEYTEGIISGAINRAVNEGDPEVYLAGKRAENAAAALEQALLSNGVDVVSPSSFPDCKVYVKPDGAKKKSASKYSGRGYRVLDSASKKFRTDLVEKTSCDSMLFANFKFEKMQKSGAVWLRVTLSVCLTDAQGKAVYRNKYTAVSDQSVESGRGDRYDHEGLCALADSTVLKAVNLFMQDSVDVPRMIDNVETLPEKKVYDEATMAKLESARLMLKDGVSPEQIAKWQDLPLELVMELVQE